MDPERTSLRRLSAHPSSSALVELGEPASQEGIWVPTQLPRITGVPWRANNADWIGTNLVPCRRCHSCGIVASVGAAAIKSREEHGRARHRSR